MQEKRLTEARIFTKEVNRLLKARKLLKEDFEKFKRELVENPEVGDLIPGTGGIRKVRLKSSSKGKRGGFRICYLNDDKNEEIFLLLLYPKNEKENFSFEEKKELKSFAEAIKRR